MIRPIMEKICKLPEGMLSGTAEVDEGYLPAASKGVPLETTKEERTYASRRKMKRGPGRGKFEKDTPMVMIYHERKDAGKPDRTLFEVSRDDKSIADRVEEKIDALMLNFVGGVNAMQTTETDL